MPITEKLPTGVIPSPSPIFLEIPDRPMATGKLQPIKINDLWSDDPKDKNYNHKVYSNDYSFSNEKLRRSDNLYDAFEIGRASCRERV